METKTYMIRGNDGKCYGYLSCSCLKSALDMIREMRADPKKWSNNRRGKLPSSFVIYEKIYSEPLPKKERERKQRKIDNMIGEVLVNLEIITRKYGNFLVSRANVASRRITR